MRGFFDDGTVLSLRGGKALGFMFVEEEDIGKNFSNNDDDSTAVSQAGEKKACQDESYAAFKAYWQSEECEELVLEQAQSFTRSETASLSGHARAYIQV